MFLFLQKLSTLTIAISPSLREQILRCKQVWNNWVQLRCRAHSPLIVGKTIALLFSFGKCIVQIQCIRLNFACTKKNFNLSAEGIIMVRNEHLCARCAVFLLKIKQIPPFSCRLAKGFTYLKRVQNQFEMFWRCLMFWQVLFQQRKMRILRRFCNNSEIPLWSSKVWSLVLRSQSSFTLQEHVKMAKTDKTRFFFV